MASAKRQMLRTSSSPRDETVYELGLDKTQAAHRIIELAFADALSQQIKNPAITSAIIDVRLRDDVYSNKKKTENVLTLLNRTLASAINSAISSDAETGTISESELQEEIAMTDTASNRIFVSLAIAIGRHAISSVAQKKEGKISLAPASTKQPDDQKFRDGLTSLKEMVIESADKILTIDKKSRAHIDDQLYSASRAGTIQGICDEAISDIDHLVRAR